jgi:hypothetical protein
MLLSSFVLDKNKVGKVLYLVGENSIQELKMY